jgi:hypothetical protein
MHNRIVPVLFDCSGILTEILIYFSDYITTSGGDNFLKNSSLHFPTPRQTILIVSISSLPGPLSSVL